ERDWTASSFASSTFSQRALCSRYCRLTSMRASKAALREGGSPPPSGNGMMGSMAGSGEPAAFAQILLSSESNSSGFTHASVTERLKMSITRILQVHQFLMDIDESTENFRESRPLLIRSSATLAIIAPLSVHRAGGGKNASKPALA